VGKNSSFIQVPFLNLMANLQERAGGVLVRLGGNTQEFATMVEEGDHRIEPGHTFGKTLSGSTQTVSS
jgi:adenosine/AMP kinase